MKKRFLYIMMLAGLTACTNDDNIVTEVPTTQAEAPVYQVSIPAGFDDGAQTRAVSIDGTGAMVATFRTTEGIYVYYKTEDGTAQDANYNAILLHPDADGATAKLTGNLTFYGLSHYFTVDENDVLLLTINAGDINYNDYNNTSNPQSGTLACLNLFDFASCEVSITGISGAGTPADPYTLTTSKAKFVNAQSMFKFTFTGLPFDVGVKTVTIHSAGNKLIKTYNPSPGSPDIEDDVTIDFNSHIADGYHNASARRNANGPGVVYAALRFLPLGSGETDDITFTVTGTDNKTYIATKTSPAGGFANGKYYTSTIALAKSIVSASSEDIGKVVCATGHLHPAKSDVPDGCTAVGILGKVTETGHGLILALQDAEKQTRNTINGWTSETTTYASTTLKVLPDDARSQTSYTMLGTTAVSNWALAQKSDYSAIFQNLGSGQNGVNVYTYDANVNAYITTGVGGSELSGTYWSATEYGGVSTWYFNSNSWNYSPTTEVIYNVRPVLGF